MSEMTKARRSLAVALFAAALVLAAAPVAFAHAAYKSSTPDNDETVSSPPSQVTAEFTEPITDNSYLEVYDPCGQRVDNSDSQVSGYNMSISMSADKAGEYTVEFAAQSVDTHVTYGSFSFTSSGGASCSGDGPEEPAPGGNGTGGGSGGGSGNETGGGGGSGGGPGAGPAADPSSSASGSGARKTGGSGGAAKMDHSQHGKAGKTGKAGKGKGGGPAAGSETPVPFENTGGRAPAPPAPGTWDLPIGGVLMALALCVMIGAAGGRVYAGIVAPPRR